MEDGGPEIATPLERGFGTTLIEAGIRYELDGEALLRFEPSGLVCEISFPMRATERYTSLANRAARTTAL